MEITAPADINARFAAGYNDRDVDALAALYEDDAAVAERDGSTAVGEERIRAHLAGLVGLGGSMAATNRYAVVHGELALVGADFAITFDDGRPPVEGRTAELLRRRPDGTWRYVIDHPHAFAP